MASTASLGKQLILLTGPLFFGTLFNWALMGILALQVYIYFRNGFQDYIWIRILVVGAFLLDILQTIFATHCVWNMIIISWGDITAFERLPWTSNTFPIMSGIVGALVQVFFAWRVFILKKGLAGCVTSLLIVLTALMQCTSAIIFAARWAVIGPVQGVKLLKPECTVWLVGSAACDLIIATAMSHIFYSVKMQTSFERTNSLMDRLIAQAIHSGAVTAVAAVVEVILFLAQPENFLHNCVVLFLGKLYSNVLMANLNGRRRNDMTYTIHSDPTLNSSDVNVNPFKAAPADAGMELKSNIVSV